MLLQQAVATVVVGHCRDFWALFSAKINGDPFGTLGATHLNPGDALRSGEQF